MHITLKIWRQKDGNSQGRFATYELADVTPDMSFLEMMDMLNTDLAKKGEDTIAFDSDCREGICGSCCIQIDGRPHGPLRGVAACQLYMRSFQDNATIVAEPFRAKAFPIIKDLVIDRTALDRIVQAGGFVSVKTGGAPEANSIPIPKPVSELAFESAACIGCGACRRLQECLRHAFCRRQSVALGQIASRPSRAQAAGSCDGGQDGC